MRSFAFHAASEHEVMRLVRSLVAARIFCDEAELWFAYCSDPWRIQVSARGDVAVIGRWRDHLDLLGIEALWCRLRVMPDAIRSLRVLAAEQGYSGLVSPLTLLEEVVPYEVAGMRLAQIIMSYQLRIQGPGTVARGPEGVLTRETGSLEHDVATFLALESACFDPFWQYDVRRLSRLMSCGRAAVAERDGRAVGYTLFDVDRREGTLVRLGVLPELRGVGIGSLLVADAIASARSQGCERIALSTQVENRPARSVYECLGFRDTHRRFAFLRCEAP